MTPLPDEEIKRYKKIMERNLSIIERKAGLILFNHLAFMAELALSGQCGSLRL